MVPRWIVASGYITWGGSVDYSNSGEGGKEGMMEVDNKPINWTIYLCVLGLGKDNS